MIRYGMVGGGPKAFIGDVHRSAIRLDNRATLVCGSFSHDDQTSKTFGRTLNIDEDRLYRDYIEMAEKESKRDDKIDFAVVVTPNAYHYEICKEFLLHDINVVRDKPLTLTSEESKELLKIKNERDLLFCVTYSYTGYTCVKQMRCMIKDGTLGKIRFVNCEYPQGSLSKKKKKDSRGSSWRSDPSIAGKSHCLGDIGTHIENLSYFVTSLDMKRVSARLDTLVDESVIDDNACVMVDFEGGAKGLFWSSKIANGYDNAVRIRVFGEKGSLEWVQEDPDHFIYYEEGGTKQIMSRGRDDFDSESQKYSRLPAGHVEGLYEAFANIYEAFIDTINLKNSGEIINEREVDYPTAEMGYQGIVYVERCLESNEKDGEWVSIK